MSHANGNGNGNGNGKSNGTVVGAATKLGTNIIHALPSGFLALILMICFIIYEIRDVQKERVAATRDFAIACAQALAQSQPGRQ